MVLAVTDQSAFCGKLGAGPASDPVGDDADRMAGRAAGFSASSNERESKERKEGSDPFHSSSFSSIGLYQITAVFDWVEIHGSGGNEGHFHSSKTGELAYSTSLYPL